MRLHLLALQASGVGAAGCILVAGSTLVRRRDPRLHSSRPFFTDLLACFEGEDAGRTDETDALCQCGRANSERN